MQACAPCSVSGISSPSANERSTMNLAIDSSLQLPWRPGWIAFHVRLWMPHASAIREKAQAMLISVLISVFVSVFVSCQPGRDLDAGVKPELVEDVVDMVVHRAL